MVHAGRVVVVALVALGVAQWWWGLAPLALLAAGYVAIAGVLAERLPLRVALPAALLAQNACYLALMLLAPLVLDGPMRPGLALAILVLPCGVAVLGGPPWRLPPLPLLAGAVTGGVVMVVMVLWIGRDDSFTGIAWSTSGDARFHLLFLRDVLAEGGLHGRAFTYQPQYQEALTALLVDTHGRGRLGPGALLAHDLRLTAQVAVALTVLWTLATSAILVGLGPLRARSAAPVLLVASVLPLTGIGLGVLLLDGFLPVLLLVPLLLATLTMLSWLLTVPTREVDDGSITLAVTVTAAALSVLAFTWTPFAVVAGVAALWPWWTVLRRSSGRERAVRAGVMAAGASAAAAYAVVVLLNASDFVRINGAIQSSPPASVAVVPLVMLLIALAGWSALPRAAYVPFLAGTVATLAITVYTVQAQDPGLPWNYFPAKVPWIWTLVGLPLLLVPFAHPLTVEDARRARLTPTVGAVTVLVVAVSLSTVTSPLFPRQVAWLQSGRAPATPDLASWSYPDAASLRLAVRLGHPRNRYVVYGISPGNDRLANFWLAAYDSLDDREFFRWTYSPQGGIADVCALLELQPDRIVVTADATVPQQLADQCGLADVQVEPVGAISAAGTSTRGTATPR